ncbi:DUF348 domain-containing protein [Candidatus Saccharibacteria bacterium]|nr:DUF348 domain-containing protein [Candidatus Saccharibacteria bacterium]
MKTLIRRSTTLFGAITVAFILLTVLILVIVASRVGATSAARPQNGHLVTIHDRGSQVVVLTQSDSVGDALKEAGVVVDKSDAVEPAVSEKLVASEYEVNIYRARPVIVVDGATKQKVITPYQTSAQIAKSVGIKLYDEDKTILSRTDNIVADGAGFRMTIYRATPFTLTLYGQTTAVRTQGDTVGEMLDEKGIKLGPNDRVSLDQSTKLTEGLLVKVWREGKHTVTVDEEVNFSTEKIQDGDQEIGYHAVKTPGEKGMRSVTYEVVIQDGQETGRTEIASLTTKESKKQIEIIGAKYKGAYTTPGENEIITWNFLLSNGFTREQTAGIMGNLKQEHGFNTTGDGLVQWTGARKNALLSRPDPYNIYTQLDFLMYELNTGYSGVQSAIKASSSVVDAVTIFQNRFERCGVCVESRRIQFAYNILASH